MRIVFSRPRTLELAREARLPSDFVGVADELQLANDCEQRCWRRFADRATKLRLLLRLLPCLCGADCVVTGRYGEEFSIFRGLLGLRHPPFILLDFEWRHKHRSTFRRLASKLIHRLIARGATKLGVFCKEEAVRYSEWYGIVPEKFVWVPYCTGIEPTDFPASDNGYIFSGGSYDRDWPTFFSAVHDLPAKVRIAASPSTVPSLQPSLANVTLLGRVAHDDFYRQIAGASLVVLSLTDNQLRFPGLRTYVSAMRLGKCVIINEPIGARSYISNGETGILVKQGDAGELRRAILSMLENEPRRSAIAQRAREYAAQHFSMESYFRRLESLAAEVIGNRG